MRQLSPFLLPALVLVLAACGEEGTSPPDGDTVPVPGSVAPAAEGLCADLGLPADAFQVPDAPGFAFGDLAGDFTVQTTDGPWVFSEQFSGCESYVFLTYVGGPENEAMWQPFGTTNPLVNTVVVGTENVHYFFLSLEQTAEDRAARMAQMETYADEAIEAWVDDPAARPAWRARYHFVTERANEVEGSVGAFLTDYLGYIQSPGAAVDLGDRGMAPAPAPVVFGIDREQRWDAGGNLSPAVGLPDDMAMAAYLGDFYNHRAEVRHRLAAEAEATTVVSLVDESVTERIFNRTVALPEPARMAQFDTLEFYVEVNCPYRNPFACSEWDRIARIQLCVDGEACEERLEMIRWITQYWRRGRRMWTIDASSLMPLLGEGGTEATFRIVMGPEWERATERDTRIELLFTRRERPRALDAQFAFRGGEFGSEYNSSREPLTFTAPADATRAELVLILSGHGQQEQTGCAEWCDHQHQFVVNGTDLPLVSHGLSIGQFSPRGCADQSDRGVPPGQWGNWAQERAYWCPGLPVEQIRLDITDLVTFGGDNSLSYEGAFAGAPLLGGNIDLSSYVVFSQ